MTNTAATVKYHVSDFLQDRHPYNVGQSYTAQRTRDAGKAFNGMMPQAIDSLIDLIDDENVEAMQKAIALKHLHAHSAGAEKKITLLRKDMVPRIVRLLGDIGGSSHLIEQLSMMILRSLCIIPQGIHCVVAQGGLKEIILSLSKRHELTDREEARTSAASAVALIAGSWAGRAWVLGEQCPPDMELPGYDVPALSSESAGELSQTLADVLVGCVEQDAATPAIVAYCLSAVSQLTLERAGLQRCLIAGALRATSSALERFTRDDVWVYSESTVESETVLHGATAVWHLALDEVGNKSATELPFVQHIGRLIGFVLPVKEKLLGLKAALAGAVCALTMQPPLKHEAIAPLTSLAGEPATLLDLVLKLLVQANELHEPMYQAKKHDKPNPMPGVRIDHVAAVVKNCVQAVRLIVELPAARDVLLARMTGDETYRLRRQLFYQTTHQQAFGVLPV